MQRLISDKYLLNMNRNMRKRWLFGSAGLIVLLVAGAVVWSFLSPVGGLVLRSLLGQSAAYIADGDGRLVAVLPEELEHHINPRDKSADFATLDGLLNTLIRIYEREGLEAASVLVPIPGPKPGTMLVTIYQEAFQKGTGSTEAIAESLQILGIEIQDIGESYIAAYVPIALLAQVAQLPHVQFVWTEFPLDIQQGSTNPTKGSDAAQAHGALDWHAAGLNGLGVKVGILDVGFDGYAKAQIDGHVPIPAAVRCLNQAPSISVSCLSGSNHGTAVAEALMEVAPDATVYLAQVYSGPDLQKAVLWLVSQGVDIINFSGGTVWDGPGDGTSHFFFSPLRRVDYAVSRGVTWVNAAGNENQHTWYEPDAHTDMLTNFDYVIDKGSTFFPQNTCNSVHTVGSQLQVFLRWGDSWSGAQLDLDIQVYDAGGQRISGEWANSGENRQMGRLGHIPFEVFVSGSKLPVGQSYCIKIHNYSAARGRGPTTPTWVQLRVNSGTAHSIDFLSRSHSLTNPAESANPGLLAVGAAPYTSPGMIADYSSRGPTVDGRTRLDLVGVDGTFSDAIGRYFLGTSQAAPHVAGLAALVKQRFPQYSPVEVADYLRQHSAPHLDSPNRIWGHGLAQLPPMTSSQNPTPTAVKTVIPEVETPIPIGTVTSQPLPAITGTDIPDGTPVAVPTVSKIVKVPTIPSNVNCTDLLQGIEIHTRGENLETPLHLAAEEGNSELVLCLLAAGADPDIQDSAGNAPLHRVVDSPYDTSETVRVLLAYGANPNALNLVGRTPLHSAMLRYRKAEMVQALMAGGADPDLRDNAGDAPLHRSGQAAEAARLMLEGGADPDIQDSAGNAPLHRVVDSPYDTSETVRVLLAYGANPNALNLVGRTPLHSAMLRYRKAEMVQALMAGGADPDLPYGQDNAGDAPLHRSGQAAEAARLMLEGGADPDIQDSAGNAPLHRVVDSPYDTSETVRVLLAYGANPNALNLVGRTPLHSAMLRYRKAEMVQALMAGGADPDLRDNAGDAPLHRSGQAAEAARLMLEGGADPDIQDSAGNAPLHRVVDSPYDTSETVRVLLAYGANPNALNLVGRTPLHSAMLRYRKAEMVQALMAGGADPDLRDNAGDAPLHRSGQAAEAARLMLEGGADPDIQDSAGNAPLHRVVDSPYDTSETVRVLLAYGANPNALNLVGRTPLHSAMLRYRVEAVVQALLAGGALPILQNNNLE